MFHECSMLIGSWKGRKDLRVGIFFSKNLLGKQTFLDPRLQTLALGQSSVASF